MQRRPTTQCNSAGLTTPNFYTVPRLWQVNRHEHEQSVIITLNHAGVDKMQRGAQPSCFAPP